jgi:hypothetical protein
MPEWLTYAAIARRMGISPEAARHRARRLEWPIRRPNAPNQPVEVEVPDAELLPRPDVQPGGGTGAYPQEIERLKAALARADERAAEASAGQLHAEGLAAGLKLALEALEAARREADARADREAEGRREADAAAAQAQALAAENANTATAWQSTAEAAEARLCAFRALPWWRRIVTTP